MRILIGWYLKSMSALAWYSCSYSYVKFWDCIEDSKRISSPRGGNDYNYRNNETVYKLSLFTQVF